METIKEKLVKEFTAAIDATFGDYADKQYDKESVGTGDIELIANKVKWYLDLI